jgi:hypothetical protein
MKSKRKSKRVSSHSLAELKKKVKGVDYGIREVEIIDEAALQQLIDRKRLASRIWKPIVENHKDNPKTSLRE